jgi:aryl-alcohol dehydrogenase-like predicted oxidoreductase
MLPPRSDRTIPRFGQGTWGMGERRAQRSAEVAALRYGIERGIALIDTAEMYGDGGAEEIIGEAIAANGSNQRDGLFIVFKVLPDNASRRGAARSPPANGACGACGSTISISICCTGGATRRWHTPSPPSPNCRPQEKSAPGASAISTSPICRS